MRVRSTRPNTINPGMGLGPWGPGEERELPDDVGKLLAAQAGFMEVKAKAKAPAKKAKKSRAKKGGKS